MRRIMKIAALVTTFGISLGLAATLAAVQPAGAGPTFLPPDDIKYGQKICVGEDVGADEVLDDYDIDIKITSQVCAPLMPGYVYADVTHNI